MKATLFVRLALVAGLFVLGALALAPAEASGLVKYGASGQAYYWQPGSC